MGRHCNDHRDGFGIAVDVFAGPVEPASAHFICRRLGLFETLRDNTLQMTVSKSSACPPMAKLAGACSGNCRMSHIRLHHPAFAQRATNNNGFGSQISLAVISPDPKHPLADLGSLLRTRPVENWLI